MGVGAQAPDPQGNEQVSIGESGGVKHAVLVCAGSSSTPRNDYGSSRPTFQPCSCRSATTVVEEESSAPPCPTRMVPNGGAGSDMFLGLPPVVYSAIGLLKKQ
ncbi:hypothetical protein MTO96_051377 [Rhipicephalus appendiculatus]